MKKTALAKPKTPAILSFQSSLNPSLPVVSAPPKSNTLKSSPLAPTPIKSTRTNANTSSSSTITNDMDDFLDEFLLFEKPLAFNRSKLVPFQELESTNEAIPEKQNHQPVIMSSISSLNANSPSRTLKSSLLTLSPRKLSTEPVLIRKPVVSPRKSLVPNLYKR